MRTKHWIAALLALSVCPAWVNAQAVPPPAADLKQPPADGLVASFASLDEDRNGTLSQLEYAKAPDPERPFLQLDRDGNDKLDPAEYAVVAAPRDASPPGDAQIQLPARAPPVPGTEPAP